MTLRFPNEYRFGNLFQVLLAEVRGAIVGFEIGDWKDDPIGILAAVGKTVCGNIL